MLIVGRLNDRRLQKAGQVADAARVLSSGVYTPAGGPSVPILKVDYGRILDQSDDGAGSSELRPLRPVRRGLKILLALP